MKHIVPYVIKAMTITQEEELYSVAKRSWNDKKKLKKGKIK